MKVLIDNLLSRGFYAYLNGFGSNRFARDCFWQFIEAIVLYDKILITDVENEVTDLLSKVLSPVLQLTNHEEELKLPSDWWLPKKENELPNFLKDLIQKKSLFNSKELVYNPNEILHVERLGFNNQKPLVIEDLRSIILSERQNWTYSKTFNLLKHIILFFHVIVPKLLINVCFHMYQILQDFFSSISNLILNSFILILEGK